MSDDHFYGLPNLLWDDLSMQAEDLLYEEKIGQHILGLYPCGLRMYGLEEHSPSLYCIYLDSVTDLINPLRRTPREKVFSVGNSDSTISFINIYDWIASVHSNSFVYNSVGFSEVIPSRGRQIYVDEMMAVISGCVDNHLALHNHVLARDLVPWEAPKTTWLKYRTYYILANAVIYAPCINPLWDFVFELDKLNVPKDIVEIDLQLRKDALSGEKLNLELHQKYLDWMESALCLNLGPVNPNKTSSHLEEAAKLVEDLYRLQL